MGGGGGRVLRWAGGRTNERKGAGFWIIIGVTSTMDNTAERLCSQSIRPLL